MRRAQWNVWTVTRGVVGDHIKFFRPRMSLNGCWLGALNNNHFKAIRLSSTNSHKPSFTDTRYISRYTAIAEPCAPPGSDRIHSASQKVRIVSIQRL